MKLINQIFLIFLAAAIFFGSNQLKTSLRKENNQMVSGKSTEELYLPDLDFIRPVSLGYETMFSKLYWFNTLNYFGKEFKSTKDYKWINHMCNLVTELDKRREDVYQFCGTVLAWITKETSYSNNILKQGIHNNPNSWYLMYLLSFNQWYFDEDYEGALKTLEAATKIEDAPFYIHKMASYLAANNSKPELAITFLTNAIEREGDKNTKEALIEQLNSAYVARDIAKIEELIENYKRIYKKEVNSLAELVKAGLMQGIPLDPKMKPYYIDKESKEVKSGSGIKKLKFSGKTAKTGILRSEFNE